MRTISRALRSVGRSPLRSGIMLALLPSVVPAWQVARIKPAEVLKKLAGGVRTVVVATHDTEIASRTDLIVDMLDGQVTGIVPTRPDGGAR